MNKLAFVMMFMVAFCATDVLADDDAFLKLSNSAFFYQEMIDNSPESGNGEFDAANEGPTDRKLTVDALSPAAFFYGEIIDNTAESENTPVAENRKKRKEVVISSRHLAAENFFGYADLK